jgi:Methyltransferase domain
MAIMQRSNSSAKLPLVRKCSELVALFAMSERALRNRADFTPVFNSIAEYEQIIAQYCNLCLANARIFEIGYGQRPERLLVLTSLNMNVRGVDLDAPVLSGSPRELFRVWRTNGYERALRTFIRFVLFDLRRRRELAHELQLRETQLKVPTDALLVQDAADVTLAPHSVDLIYSEDVFEHIPLSSLKLLTRKMASWLTPEGLALVRPNIFTGITGGHLTEWFTTERRTRKSEPWEHLRKRRYLANVYLNKLTRQDYRELFSKHFTILEERVKYPDRGREHLTSEIANELNTYSYEELFSNQVLFILSPSNKKARPG